MDMRQLLTPRMIQSMEILQLPLLALEERIEEELQANPVLELKEGADGETPEEPVEAEDDRVETKSLVVDEKSGQAEDFDRLSRIADYLDSDEFTADDAYRSRGMGGSGDGEDRDRKMDAMANAPAQEETLSVYLRNEWAMVECLEELHRAGEALITYIDDDGYLRTPLEQIAKESKRPVTVEQLKQALPLVQTMDPAGVGARDLPECLRLQLDRLEDEADAEIADQHDFELENQLISDHLKDLEMNRYPQISRKTGRSIDDIKKAVKMLGKLHPRPGRLIGRGNNQPITPDATVYFDEKTGKYEIEMSRDPASRITLSQLYQRMVKDKQVDRKTRDFLANNVRNAKWLLESIEQRGSTIRRVIQAVVDAQQEFLEKGAEYLKPLPMILVADQLGIHVATVSRAVSEKWIQTPRGIYPLRRFFSGGTTNSEGEDMSWDAVKEKLRVIIDNEDKNSPLNDDEIVEKVKEQGITLARRTVAKYRKILNIPTARQRKQF